MTDFDQQPDRMSMFLPHQTPEGIEARQAAVRVLWDKREMLPENSEEIVEDVIDAVAPFFTFSPLGDNHHNAAVCPYCSR